MGSIMRILVTLVTLTIVSGEPLDLLNFQLGSLSEDDIPSTAFAEESSPSSSYDKSASGPINLYEDPSEPSSFSSQGGDDGPGPLNYPESSSSSGNVRKPAKKYPNQNDIFSDFGGDSSHNSFNVGSGGDDSPVFGKGGSSRPAISEGYQSGPPPGYGGPRGSPGGFNMFSNSPSSFSLFRGPKSGRGPPRRPSSSSGSTGSYSSSPFSTQHHTSSSESLPVRIGKGIMGLFNSASTPSISFSLSPFKKNTQSNHGHSTPIISASTNPSTFYLSAPQKDAPSFYGVKSLKGLRNPFSFLTSESNNRYRRGGSQSLASFQQEIAQAVEKQSKRILQTSRGKESLNSFTIMPNQPMISHPKNKNQLVMASRPDGSKVILELASSSTPQQKQHKAPPPTKKPLVQYITIPQESPVQYVQKSSNKPVQYMSIPSSSSGDEESLTYTLASRPDQPFPSLTQEVTTNVQYIKNQPSNQGFTVTSANSIYPKSQQGQVYHTIMNSVETPPTDTQQTSFIHHVKPSSSPPQGTVIYSSLNEQSS